MIMKLKLPKIISVFPLSGVIFFPKTNLPLNIFEKKYLDLVNDCMKNNKLMGMVQSKKIVGQVYKIGCLGKIEDFRKSDDGSDATLYDIADDLHWKSRENFTLTHSAERIKIYAKEQFNYDIHEIKL